MKELFHTILYEPIFNLFIGFYNVIPDVGVVIIILTVLIKLALYPQTKKSIEAQKSLSELQPKMQEIKEKYKNDQQKIAQETMQLYKTHKVNPLGSCLPLLIQLPVFLALYWVLRDGLTGGGFESLYSFVPKPESVDPLFLGFLDLSKPVLALGVLAAGAQYFQAKMFTKKRAPKVAGEGAKDEDMAAVMNKQMTYMMPIITLFISFSLPGGLLLYWFLSTLITLVQQKFIFKKDDDQDSQSGVIEGKIVSD
ncbi:membrane protein insertase YidC [Candidatus Nomurabacteria bacterium]|nr:membrane protein insertase YidC [Candidatus Nomurabacteria bacterium]